MYGFIDGYDFGEMEAMKYYAPPSTWSDEKKRENARMKIYSGEWYGAEKKDGYFAKLIKDEDGNIVGVEMKIADAYFSVDGSRCSSDDYYLAYRAFWLTHVIIPDTGLKLFAWSDVSDYSDGDETKAEKMANMLLYGSGQKFLNFKNGEKELGD